MLALNIGNAQVFSDQGLCSGSGLVALPTASIAPLSEFKLQYARIGYLKNDRLGANVVGLTSGFSSSMEVYVRVTGEQLETMNSQVTYGFGGKFLVPLDVPVVRRLAFWMETAQSDAAQPSVLFPSDAFRTAAIATLDSGKIHPTFVVGLANIEHQTNPLIGAGVTFAANHSIHVGIECMHGYSGQHSTEAAASVSVRLLPNIALNASPGYLTNSTLSTWILSIGVSCSTTGIDFMHVEDERKADEFILPSLEDIEKQLKDKPLEKDSSNDGSSILDSLDQGSRFDERTWNEFSDRRAVRQTVRARPSGDADKPKEIQHE